MTYILFVIGFVALIKGADFLVDGASAIAKKLKVSDLVIGLTIVSLGTSMPELLVNIMASIDGNSAIGIGNVLGSNIANILLVLGVSALIFPLPITRNTIFIEIPFSLTATLLLGFLANVSVIVIDGTVTVKDEMSINRLDGGILLFFFLLFLGYIYIYAREKKLPIELEKVVSDEQSFKKSMFNIVLGSIGLFFGGMWVVDGAVEVATAYGWSQSFIGLTIVALGTSLPELVTSARAAFRRNTDIAVGNVIGSNIFNLLWILGISALIRPLPFEMVSNLDIFMIIGASTMLLLAVAIGKRAMISRWEGMIFVLAYIGYIYILVQRG